MGGDNYGNEVFFLAFLIAGFLISLLIFSSATDILQCWEGHS